MLFMRKRQLEKQKKTWENKRKQSVFLGFSFVFFCFSNWPKAQIQFVELTLNIKIFFVQLLIINVYNAYFIVTIQLLLGIG